MSPLVSQQRHGYAKTIFGQIFCPTSCKNLRIEQLWDDFFNPSNTFVYLRVALLAHKYTSRVTGIWEA